MDVGDEGPVASGSRVEVGENGANGVVASRNGWAKGWADEG